MILGTHLKIPCAVENVAHQYEYCTPVSNRNTQKYILCLFFLYMRNYYIKLVCRDGVLLYHEHAILVWWMTTKKAAKTIFCERVHYGQNLWICRQDGVRAIQFKIMGRGGLEVGIMRACRTNEQLFAPPPRIFAAPSKGSSRDPGPWPHSHVIRPIGSSFVRPRPHYINFWKN